MKLLILLEWVNEFRRGKLQIARSFDHKYPQKESVNTTDFLYRDSHQGKKTSESTNFSQACPATSKLAKICQSCPGVHMRRTASANQVKMKAYLFASKDFQIFKLGCTDSNVVPDFYYGFMATGALGLTHVQFMIHPVWPITPVAVKLLW